MFDGLFGDVKIEKNQQICKFDPTRIDLTVNSNLFFFHCPLKSAT